MLKQEDLNVPRLFVQDTRQTLSSGRSEGCRREVQGEGFASGRVLAALLEEFAADGFVELSVREYSGGQDDIGALVGFINDDVFDIRGLHESEGFLGIEQSQPLRGGEAAKLCRGLMNTQRTQIREGKVMVSISGVMSCNRCGIARGILWGASSWKLREAGRR
jgi:hypothetical protein